jgi:hypothetical protein
MSALPFAVRIDQARTIGFKQGTIGERCPPARVLVTAHLSADAASLKAAMDEAYTRMLLAAEAHTKGSIVGEHHNERFDVQLQLEVQVEAGS